MITLIHPSRGRAAKAAATLFKWLNNASGKIKIEHILSIDNDDEQKQKYFDLFKSSNITCNNNTNLVQATNVAAKLANGDILVYLSDDFSCPKQWDGLITEKLKTHIGKPGVLKVSDGHQKPTAEVITIPIITKEAYKTLDYFFHPAYKSMYADKDLFFVCEKKGWIINATELLFTHEHYCAGYTTTDETYKRSELNIETGKQTFRKRKSENFIL